jgi:hypothetical protein
VLRVEHHCGQARLGDHTRFEVLFDLITFNRVADGSTYFPNYGH